MVPQSLRLARRVPHLLVWATSIVRSPITFKPISRRALTINFALSDPRFLCVCQKASSPVFFTKTPIEGQKHTRQIGQRRIELSIISKQETQSHPEETFEGHGRCPWLIHAPSRPTTGRLAQLLHLTAPAMRSPAARVSSGRRSHARSCGAHLGRWEAFAENFLNPNKDERVCFVSFLLRGLGFPIHPFLRGLVEFYGLQLHNFTPVSILHISGFVAFCEMFLDCEAHFELWRKFLPRLSQPRGVNS
ncbi:hypothetical protein VPH35_028115 [Triticum aestivum]